MALAYNNDDNQAKIASADGIHPLVKLVRDGGTALMRAAAAGALWNLSVNDDNKVKIADAGGIPALGGEVVRLYHRRDPDGKYAGGALWSLSLNADNRVAIASWSLSLNADNRVAIAPLLNNEWKREAEAAKEREAEAVEAADAAERKRAWLSNERKREAEAAKEREAEAAKERKRPAKNAPIEAELQEYLETHKISNLFTDIRENLLLSKPEDPIQFIIDRLKEKQAQQSMAKLEEGSCSRNPLCKASRPFQENLQALGPSSRVLLCKGSHPFQGNLWPSKRPAPGRVQHERGWRT